MLSSTSVFSTSMSSGRKGSQRALETGERGRATHRHCHSQSTCSTGQGHDSPRVQPYPGHGFPIYKERSSTGVESVPILSSEGFRKCQLRAFQLTL